MRKIRRALALAALALAASLSAQPAPSSQKLAVKPGSIDDVNAVGKRSIGGRGKGNWYSAETESRMGKLYADAMEKSAPFVSDPAVNEYVNRIGQKIVSNSDCKAPFTIRVVDSGEINAFALPGGYLFIYAGLIQNAENEAELAGVMAHEIAHVCAHHAAREMTRLNYAQFGAMPLMMAGGWTGVALAGSADVAVPEAYLRFSRDFEAQADYLGVQYMYRAGYDPQALIAYFERVQALEKRKPGAVAREFAGHPATPERIQRIRDEIARILPPRTEYSEANAEFAGIKARLANTEKQQLEDADGAVKK